MNFNKFRNLWGNRESKKLASTVQKINELEKDLQSLNEGDLLNRSKELIKKVKGGESEESVLEEAFALVRETSRRTLNQRHFDTQLIGGLVLHQGKIAEMLTGEGKTLAATLPVYLNALSGKGVHVVTVNDYLARRDAVWMGQIYHALGLKISCLVHDQAYQYDPEFTTSELDQERDTTGSFKIVEKFLRPISRKEAYQADITYGTNHEFGFDYLRDNLIARLSDRVQHGQYYTIIDEVDSILIDEARTPLIISAPDRQSSDFYKMFAQVVKQLKPEEDYIVDEKLKVVNITEPGIEKVEKAINVSNIFDAENSRLVHYLQESLKAKALFRNDKEYVVKGNEIIIVDEFTGRLMTGRRYAGGLHQAIEAKEGVLVKEENRTLAQITIQNYFRLYKKIAGMTGTAQTSAEEFHKVYELEVVSIPPNRPMIREDLPDVVYKSQEVRYKAVVAEVKKRHQLGQPILLGTVSIERNELLSKLLKQAGIPHEVLNAKNNEREGSIIAQAGRLGAVTVATNMAGRGVDVVLGGNPQDAEKAKKVVELGGLHIIGTERHEARRIDDQLRGRAGRQGDPGSSQFFLSLEDDLLRIFGGERIKNMMESLKFPEDVPIESKMVSKAVNQAQQKIEGANFDLRRHLLDFDDVLNKQRSAIYMKRSKILEAAENKTIKSFLEEVLVDHKKVLSKIPAKLEADHALLISQHLVRIMDTLWLEHLENLEALRQSVNIRAYAQHDPLVEYRREASQLYTELNNNFKDLVTKTILPLLEIDLSKIQAQVTALTQPSQSPPKKIGRNDPCYCGSGKKYKKCHG